MLVKDMRNNIFCLGIFAKHYLLAMTTLPFTSDSLMKSISKSGNSGNSDAGNCWGSVCRSSSWNMSKTLLFPAGFAVNNKISKRGELSLLGAMGFVLSVWLEQHFWHKWESQEEIRKTLYLKKKKELLVSLCAVSAPMGLWNQRDKSKFESCWLSNMQRDLSFSRLHPQFKYFNAFLRHLKKYFFKNSWRLQCEISSSMQDQRAADF